MQTLSGQGTFRIPPRRKTGRTFRLNGQGMPKMGGGGRGDFYASVKVVLPDTADGLCERDPVPGAAGEAAARQGQ